MYLDILIMRSVKTKPMSGAEIALHIGRTVGWKPSPGSVYPLLKKLEDNGFVFFIKQKKKKLYSLTMKGAEYLEKLEKEEFISHFEQQFTMFKSLSEEEDVAGKGVKGK